MLQNLSGWHFVILLVIILLLFGAPRLPALARSLGQSFRILKGEVKQSQADDDATPAAPTTTPSVDGAPREAQTPGTAEPGDPATRP